jgi:hypothetical protein
MSPAYDSLGIPLTVLDATTHTIGNEGLKARRRIGKTASFTGDYIKCGTTGELEKRLVKFVESQLR